MKSISRSQRLTPTFLGVIASRGDVIRQLQIVSHANRREQQQQQQQAYIYSCTILIIIKTIQIIIIIIIRNQLRKYAKLETCRLQRRQWVLGNNLKSTLRMRNAVYTLEHRSHFVWIYILIATNESIEYEYIPHDICQSEWRFVCAFDVAMDVVTLRPPGAVPPIPST